MNVPAVTAAFPYLPPAHRDLMEDLTSAIDARVGPTLLPSSVPADVLYFENQAGTSQGALDIRSGAQDSSVDFILESWLHCKVPSGDLNITTIFAFLNAATDAPHLLMEFIQGSPTSLILFIDLLPRRDLVLYPAYLTEFYESTPLDKLRHDLEQLPQVSPYRSSSLYIRSVLSPTAIAVSIDCSAGGESLMEEIIGVHISRAVNGVVEIWMDKCANKSKELDEGAINELLRRDGLIKNKTVEIDLAANLPRLFGADIANKIVVEIQKAFRL